MTIHVYHPYRQPDGENFCQAVNGHCSHLCLPAPRINEKSPRISCACPTGLKLMDDGLMCVEDGECHLYFWGVHFFNHQLLLNLISLQFLSLLECFGKSSHFHSSERRGFDECYSIGCENWKIDRFLSSLLPTLRLLIHIYQILVRTPNFFFMANETGKSFSIKFSLSLFFFIDRTSMLKQLCCLYSIKKRSL